MRQVALLVMFVSMGASQAGCGGKAPLPAAPASLAPAPPRVELPVPEGTVIIDLPQFFLASAITISADGQYLFANDALGAAYLWKIADNRATQIDSIARPAAGAPFSRHIRRGVLSPDGSRLAALMGDQIIIVRTPDIQQEVCSIRREGTSSFLAFTPDASRLLSLEGGRWRVYDAASGGRLADYHPHGFFLSTHCGFDPAGANVLVADVGGLSQIELTTGKALKLFSFMEPPQNYAGHGVSADGNWVIGAAADRVDIWEARSKTKTATWPVTKKCFSPLITSDGRFAILLTDQTQLLVWDVATKQQVAAWDVQGHNLGMPLIADRAGKVALYSSSGTQIRVFSLPK